MSHRVIPFYAWAVERSSPFSTICIMLDSHFSLAAIKRKRKSENNPNEKASEQKPKKEKFDFNGQLCALLLFIQRRVATQTKEWARKNIWLADFWRSQMPLLVAPIGVHESLRVPRTTYVKCSGIDIKSIANELWRAVQQMGVRWPQLLVTHNEPAMIEVRWPSSDTPP